MRGLDDILAADILHRTGLPDETAAHLHEEQLTLLAQAVAALARSFIEPGAGYLYTERTASYAAPVKLPLLESRPRKYATLSEAVWALVQHRKSQALQVDQADLVRTAVERMVKRLERRLKKIEKDIEELGRFEQYKRFGDLLQINRDRLRRGMTSIRVEDVFADPPAEIEIPLDPALPPEANVERWFRRYRKGREGMKTAERRLEITRAELAHWREIQTAIRNDFDRAVKQYEDDIQGVLPRADRTARTTTVRLPYREYILPTGLRLFVGRQGPDNDRTTFQYAKPYELWFHTQQCPGSHVVMKFPHKTFQPSRREIEQAAAVAAWHSKARHDSLVPVIYTQRRYVRKPRKAAPGLVVVEREKSIMVRPELPGPDGTDDA